MTGVPDGIEDGTVRKPLKLNIVDSATADPKWHSLPEKNKDVDVYNVLHPLLQHLTLPLQELGKSQ